MRNRIDKIDKIIKAENLLRDGVDPRKIFSELHGVPNKNSGNLDYFTVYLPGVGYNWIVNKEFLSRDIWYTYSGVFKNDRCTVGMYEDKNWIKTCVLRISRLYPSQSSLRFRCQMWI